MIRNSLLFSAPRRIKLIEEKIGAPRPGEVLVETAFSSISAGTELLIYRGAAPAALSADATLPHLSHPLIFPLKYGYSAVGRVTRLGRGVRRRWKGQRVFAFHPHADRFNAGVETLLPIPPWISDESALFLPNMESALNFVMDGAPLIGERVVVLGQGIVGLLTTGLLAEFPLESLVTADGFPARRAASLTAGARLSLDTGERGQLSKIRAALGGEADLVFELSGNPEALQTAIDVAGFDGRIVAGSWYGKRRAKLNLGGDFHRKRIRILSSQVSTLGPALSGRFSKARRFQMVWEMIRRIRPSQWITHRFPFDQADEAYEMLHRRPEKALQTVLVY